MAYPLTAPLVQRTFDRVQPELENVKTPALEIQAGAAAGTPAYNIINLGQACITYRADFTAIAGNPALLAQLIPYVQAQLAGATALSVTSEYTNLNTLCGNLLTAIGTDYPRDGSGRLLDRTFSATLGIVWVNLTTAQLPNVLPAISAFLAAMS